MLSWASDRTRIKPGFVDKVLIFPSAALGAQCLGSKVAGVAPQAIRALGNSLPLVLIKRIAHVRAGGWPSDSEIKSFWGAFFQKGATLPLWGVSQKKNQRPGRTRPQGR